MTGRSGKWRTLPEVVDYSMSVDVPRRMKWRMLLAAGDRALTITETSELFQD